MVSQEPQFISGQKHWLHPGLGDQPQRDLWCQILVSCLDRKTNKSYLDFPQWMIVHSLMIPESENLAKFFSPPGTFRSKFMNLHCYSSLLPSCLSVNVLQSTAHMSTALLLCASSICLHDYNSWSHWPISASLTKFFLLNSRPFVPVFG